MACYRLYFMDRHSGHIERFEEFEAAGDGAAIQLSEGRGHDGALELWSGGRKVFRLEALPQLAPGTLPAPRVASWRLRA